MLKKFAYWKKKTVKNILPWNISKVCDNKKKLTLISNDAVHDWLLMLSTTAPSLIDRTYYNSFQLFQQLEVSTDLQRHRNVELKDQDGFNQASVYQGWHGAAS